MVDQKLDLTPNETGTPQGGVISPLLCNIALHGLETELLANFGRHQVKIVRYADDFVIFSEKGENIKLAKQIVEHFLQRIGLELNEEKTRIGHSMKSEYINNVKCQVGLDFLGYNFKNVPTPIHKGVKTTRGENKPFKSISRPSLDSMKNHKIALRRILKSHKNAPLPAFMSKLASRIKG